MKNITVFFGMGLIREIKSDKKLIAKLDRVNMGLDAATTMTAKTNKGST